jgi:hypothetical protein
MTLASPQVSDWQGYHPESLIYACIGKEGADDPDRFNQFVNGFPWPIGQRFSKRSTNRVLVHKIALLSSEALIRNLPIALGRKLDYPAERSRTKGCYAATKIHSGWK